MFDDVRLNRIAHRLVMDKGRCKNPGCDEIAGSRAVTSLHHIQKNCLLEFQKMPWVGLITRSHAHEWIVTCTQSIIFVGNNKRKGVSYRAVRD